MTVELLPSDAHNARLIEAVHPPDWVNPTPAGRYNLVVLGAGTAGLVAAAGAAGLGAKVALIERSLMGGDCLNVGCVPSKALLRSARVAAGVRDAGRYGVVVTDGVRVDFAAVMERMRRLRAELSPNDSAARFRGLGVDVFLGEGRFTGPDAVEVGGQALRFSKAVIATGGRAAAPPVPGLKEAGFLTNETVFSLTELPARLAVVGAGPIGCELAQAFARFGSRVHLLDVEARVLPREDADAAELVAASLRRDGVSLHLGVSIRRVEGRHNGKGVVLAGEPDQEIAVDEILVAAGRRPTVEGLGLEAAGVEYDPKKGVTVDDRLQTSNPRVFAAGDVCSRYQFTHAADAMARIVLRNALFPFGRARVSALAIPWCTYTDPEVAHVGLYEHEAREQGIAVRAIVVPLREVDRAVLDGEDEGFVRVLVQVGGDRILGATVVAAHAGEMISEVTLAMAGRLGLGKLADVIHPYPTQAAAIKRAGDAHNRTRLTPFVKWLFEKWLAWTR
jgi:pyruvate/2-oxoglutarate dehydrogenase complex dihydrolipoamide dehydrogenase (E3) component